MDEPLINFCFPVKVLQDGDVKLVPFQHWKHAPSLSEDLVSPTAFAYLSTGPYEDIGDFITTFLSERSYPDEHMFTFAILYRENEGKDQVVGMVSLMRANPENRTVDITYLLVSSSFHGRGIAFRANKLLLQYCFDPVDEGGLGLVRVEWHATTGNDASIRVASRLGFVQVGLVKYKNLLKDGISRGKAGNGRPVPPGTAKGDLWRDVVVFSMTWDEWARHN